MKKIKITHINKTRPKIVNISDKIETKRYAMAEGFIKFNKKSFDKISKLKTIKGEIKNIAIVAGIIGAKKTSELIPLCHNIAIENIDINIKMLKNKNSFRINCEVITSSKTGVEMEALTGVTIAALTIYDMCKSIDKKMIISGIKLIKKTGGKSDYGI
tara:strand:+ start:189 stop:662 length:474 start_codon:yes stop_codon:yes gene_type:complete